MITHNGEELLSICIPTYKRNEYLIENLEIMLPFIKKYNVKVYINDNDSNSILEQNSDFIYLLRSYKNIFYKKNIPELSMDDNMIDVLKRSNSKYSIWLGDDDYIFPKDLEKLYLKLQKKEYSFIILNKTEVTKSELLMLKENRNINLKLFNTNREGEYSNLNNFFKKNYNGFRYGSLVVRKEYLEIVDVEKYKGTYHCYAGFIIESLINLEKLQKNINISVEKDIIVYMLKIDRSWKEVKYEATAGEVELYIILCKNFNFKDITYRTWKKRLKYMYIISYENEIILKKMKEFEKVLKIKNFILPKLYAKLYLFLRYFYRSLKKL